MCFNGLYALDESIQEIIKDCSFYEYIWATNSCAALSIPKLNEEQLHGLLEYEHHVHKT